jgi:predicted nuclease with TOPRIM domain
MSDMTMAEFWEERYDAVVAEKQILVADRKELKAEIEELQQQIDDLRRSNETVKGINSRMFHSLASSTYQAQDLKKQLKDGKERLDKANADRKELQVDRDFWVHDSAEKTVEIQSLKNDLEKSNSDRDAYHGLYTKLRKDYDRLFEEVRALKVPGCPSLEELRKDLDNAKIQLKSFTQSRDEWRDRAKHAEKELEEIKQEFKQSYADGYSDGNEEGQNELWEMLQMVKDMQPNEFDTECECLGDVIDMDLEDFKEAYGKWEAEQKKAAEEAKKQHVEYMRGYLKKYCVGKLCFGCPLYDASKPVSSCLFSKLTDEELEERYRKAVDSEWEKAPGYFRSTIEAVFTAEAKINKDLLKDICGIKPDDEAHKLEYGDAVRVPWRDYDYMYIGPDKRGDGKMIRLFDPKNHSVAYVSSNEHLDIRGYKIIIGNEEDLRKIWYDKDADKEEET